MMALFSLALWLSVISVIVTMVVVADYARSEFEPQLLWQQAVLVVTGLWAAVGIVWFVAFRVADARIRRIVERDAQARRRQPQ